MLLHRRTWAALPRLTPRMMDALEARLTQAEIDGEQAKAIEAGRCAGCPYLRDGHACRMQCLLIYHDARGLARVIE